MERRVYRQLKRAHKCGRMEPGKENIQRRKKEWRDMIKKQDAHSSELSRRVEEGDWEMLL